MTVDLHKLDKRLASVELENTFFNNTLHDFNEKLKENNTNINSRFDRVDDNFTDLNKQLTGIQVSMSKNEGNKEGTVKTVNKIWFVIYSIGILAAGFGIDKYF